MSILAKIFGDANERYLRELQPQVFKINNLEKEFEGFSEAVQDELLAEIQASTAPPTP